MTFKEELQQLVENFKSSKLEEVKIRLISAAEEGKSILMIDKGQYDHHVISWLKEEGFDIKLTDDQLECFLTIKW